MVGNILLNNKFKIFLHILLVYLTLQTVYPQNYTKLSLNNDDVQTCTEACTSDSITVKTVFEFWQDATESCELDPKNLFKIYKKFVANFETQINEKVSELLSDHVSISLMESLTSKLKEALSTGTLTTKPDLDVMINELYNDDKIFVLKIWQNALDEALIFIPKQKIIEQILLIDNIELKLEIMEYLLNKYETQYKNDQQFLPVLTYGISTILRQRQAIVSLEEDKKIEVILKKLPEQLLTIYQSWNYSVSILNLQNNEYMFAERHDGPAENKRYLFTFVPTKNTLRVKGKLKLQFNSHGMLALGALYDGTFKFLTAEEDNTLICLDCHPNPTQWWQVLLAEGDEFVLFQNAVTKKLLCASTKYDDNRRLVSSLSSTGHMTDLACQWKVIKRKK